MRSLKENVAGVVDLGVVLMIGIAFVALMIVCFIVYTIRDQLLPDGAPINTSTASYNQTWNSLHNITTGFDNSINLILISITVFILALAIAALLMLRGR